MIDEILIYQFDRTKKVLLVSLAILGPLINLVAYLFRGNDIENIVLTALHSHSPSATLLNLSVIVYLSYLYISYQMVGFILRKIGLSTSWNGHTYFPISLFINWVGGLLLAMLLQYFLYYIPVLGYQMPKSIDVIVLDSALYGAFATLICSYFQFSIQSTETENS